MPEKKKSVLGSILHGAEEVAEDVAAAVVGSVISGDHIKLPPKRLTRKLVSVGVQSAGKQIKSSRAGKRTLKALEAGHLSDLFGRVGKTGGQAFERWVANQGIDPKLPRTQDEWDDLLKQFAARPMHGHRRAKHNVRK